MYDTGDAALTTILALVAKCPDDYKAKCFEILLTGYVEAEVAGLKPATKSKTSEEQKPAPPAKESQLPPQVEPRFKTTAKRLDVPIDKLEALFDFTKDPFTIHAVAVPGKNKAEKIRNVALLVASRGYFSTGNWSADWEETKAQCVDQSCYDPINYMTNLKQGEGTLFKALVKGSPIELSSSGVKAADTLLKQLAEAS